MLVARLPTPYLCCVPLIYDAFCFGNCSSLLRVETYYLQECIPVGCIPPALYHAGGIHDRDPPNRDPRTETPGIETPPRTETPQTETPRQRTPRQRPPWDRDRDSPVNRITDMCKNITLPQLRCGRQ